MSSPKSILLDWAPSAHGEDLARLAQSVADAFDAVVDVLYVGPASRMAQAHAEFGTIAAGLPRLRWNDVRDDPTNASCGGPCTPISRSSGSRTKALAVIRRGQPT